jgi:hypothetical protein
MHRPFLLPRQLVLSLALAVLALAPANKLRANPEIYQKTMPAMAWVISPVDAKSEMHGTGVVVDTEKKQMVTAYHVVAERTDVVLVFPVAKGHKYETDPDYYVKNHLGYRGKVIAKDTVKDLALIEVETLPAAVKALPLASHSPDANETIHLVGNSRKYDETLWRYREGMVKSVKVATDREYKARMLEIDVSADHGDSGGPVLNQKGELVAINHAIIPGKQTCYSIDVSEVRELLNSAKQAETKGDEYDSAMNDYLDTVNQVGDLLSMIKGKASARRAGPKLKELFKHMQDLNTDLKDLESHMTPKEQEQRFLPYKAEIEQGFARFTEETKRVVAIPGVEEILRPAFETLADGTQSEPASN